MSASCDLTDKTEKETLINQKKWLCSWTKNIIEQFDSFYNSVKIVSDGISQYDSKLGNAGIAYFDSNKVFISREQTYSFTKHTYTTPSNCKYVRIWVYADNGITQSLLEEAQLQFELGAIDTTYQQY